MTIKTTSKSDRSTGQLRSSAQRATEQLRLEGIDAECISSEGGVYVNVWTVDLSDTLSLRIHDEEVKHLATKYDKRQDI